MTFQNWIDEYLRWNKSDHNNISRISVRACDVWLPDVYIRNGLKTSPQSVIITYKGRVYMDLLRETTTYCKLDLTFFPFDVQTCYIHVESFTFTTAQVSTAADCYIADCFIDFGIALNNLKPHGQWNIVKVSTRTNEEMKKNFSMVTFVLHLRRNPLFYFTYFIYPCVISAVVVVFVFLLPSDSRGKINFSVTVLLSFTVFLATMYFVLPESGFYVPYLS
ncbi:hypothetical protein HELRODRAFT_76189 [Helobdella robusta]|uniref:Uncharacterized protein n=1 Tax=Helobdella robusta TaxID=6412 RepID=T1G2G5_HELRO|nr:hypothetical protein HELRODRAFT_76189 [Helobdella robusta]ESO07802.1 hypothetical protein HELRODRAFT_76189 [Helobdella robusta]